MQTFSIPLGYPEDATEYQPVEYTIARSLTWGSATSDPLNYASILGRVSAGIEKAFKIAPFSSPVRSLASAEINRLQGHLRRARSARAKSRIELEIMRYEEMMRWTNTRTSGE